MIYSNYDARIINSVPTAENFLWNKPKPTILPFSLVTMNTQTTLYSSSNSIFDPTLAITIFMKSTVSVTIKA